MTLEETIETVERLCEAEGARTEQFQEELDAFERGDGDEFVATRAVIERERSLLARLDSLLDEEEEELASLDELSDGLTVEQAVEHREVSLTKLETHTDRLRAFAASLDGALDVIESNLDALEADGFDAELDDPQPDLRACRTALEEHNETIEGIEQNLTILNAYLF